MSAKGKFSMNRFENNVIAIPTSDQYNKNYQGVSGHNGPCVICGKACKSNRYGLIEVAGGGLAALPGSPEADPDYDEGSFLGVQPIGNDCARKHPELKPYLIEYVY